MDCMQPMTLPFRTIPLVASLVLLLVGPSCQQRRGVEHPMQVNAVPADTGHARAGGPSGPRFPRGTNPNVNLPVDISGLGQLTYRRGNTDRRLIAITFDDGPHPTHTPRLLDMLRDRNVKATFYVVGTNARAYPGILRRMVAEGHEVANHSYNHPNLSNMSPDAVRKELQDTHDAILQATGVNAQTFRPPYGALTQNQRAWIKRDFGYPTVLWDVDPQDWRRPGSSVVANRVLSATKPGSIILLHDIHSQSVDAVPTILDGLLQQGYTFVPVNQLISQ